MRRTKIKNIFEEEKSSSIIGQKFNVRGWIKTVRDQKSFCFIEINDGTTLKNLQAIIDNNNPNFQIVEKLTTGSSVSITGKIVESPGKNQKYEMQIDEIEIIGTCPNDYPLQKKRHSFEFLRTIAHLRPRTNTQGAMSRVKNMTAFSTHEFFQKEGFLYVNTPIITGSDCEGGGDLFRATTLSCKKDEMSKDGHLDFSKDYFSKPTFLTVSGQLNAEALTCALSDVYTFGPTFRADPSNTFRHLSEFWMLEPEMAFVTLNDVMKNAESFVKYVTKAALNNCEDDMRFFDSFVEKGLIERLEKSVESSYAHLSYTEAIEVLKQSNKKFEFPYSWGADLQSEHERYLSEEYCKKPVFIYDYPKEIKAFYMRENEDKKTVAAVDLLVPKIGELVGGSQREERYDILEEKIIKNNLNTDDYKWYLDLRKYGTIPHGGYGVGFERLIQYITGIENIRDVIPFPRFPGNAQY